MATTVQKLLLLDRRWIFLLMIVAITIPTVLKLRFEETPTPMTQRFFDAIENLPAGSKILMPLDYDPAGSPELGPMSKAALWHCMRKGHRIYVMTLWVAGDTFVKSNIVDPMMREFPEYRDGYGKNWVNLGYRPGLEVVIRSMANNLRATYTVDREGTAIDSLPVMNGINTVRDFDLIVSMSVGDPGTKQWVQYVVSPFRTPLIAGNTGVQAAQMMPYYPQQILGLLAAIKGAAEYEAAITKKYPEYATSADGKRIDRHLVATGRMGPQLIAHCLILLLIVFGNVLLVLDRRMGPGGRSWRAHES